MSLASKLPYDHPYAGGFPGLSSQPLPTDADALDYLSRMATADGAGVEVGVAVAVDAFFAALKATPGLFDAIKASCILCGARTITGALVPLAGDAPTSNGFVSGDYSRTVGLTGDGTSYIDSGRAGSDDPQDDNHYSAYLTSISTGAPVGVRDGSVYQYSLVSAGNYARIWNNNPFYLQTSYAPATGLTGCTRGDAAAFFGMSGGAVESVSFSSTGQAPSNHYVFSRNSSGSASDVTSATIAFYSIGTDIGSAGLAALDTAVSNLLTAIGEAL
jgi:hypothetical protein